MAAEAIHARAIKNRWSVAQAMSFGCMMVIRAVGGKVTFVDNLRSRCIAVAYAMTVKVPGDASPDGGLQLPISEMAWANAGDLRSAGVSSLGKQLITHGDARYTVHIVALGGMSRRQLTLPLPGFPSSRHAEDEMNNVNINLQRLRDLDELLTTDYEKLKHFEQELQIARSWPEV